jgi:cholest-4-en-3-one 26-monooxygenase
MGTATIDLLDLDRFQRLEHHEMFRRLRADAPVWWQDHPTSSGFWNVVKHADVVEVGRDPERFSSELGGVGLLDPGQTRLADLRGQILTEMDPPKHTRYRLLVNKGFTPRMIGLLEQHLRYRAELIVDAVIGRGSCDLVSDIAAELPLQAIAEIMGVPQEERDLLFGWSNRLIGADDPEYAASPGEGRTAAEELAVYINDLARRRRAAPRDDIVSKLINAEIDGDRLSEQEFDLFILLLTVGGNETTRYTTSAGVLALVQHPDQRALLADDLHGRLPDAIEEFLRWATPVYQFRRTATVDIELRGRAIAAGDKVVEWYVSANRDEEVFDEPFHFDITRSPNPQVSFGGGGPHFCLGANLARMELRLIFREIIERMPDLRATGEPEILRSNFISGIKHLPVAFSPGPRKHPESPMS